MSLLLEALKKAERDKLGDKKQVILAQDNVARKEATAKFISSHIFGKALELVPANTSPSSDVPKQKTKNVLPQDRVAAKEIIFAKQDWISRINIGRTVKWVIFLGVALLAMIGGAYYVWQEITYTSKISPQSNEFKLDPARQAGYVPQVSSQAKTSISPESNNLVMAPIATRTPISNNTEDGVRAPAPFPEKDVLDTDIIDTSPPVSSVILEKYSGLSANETREAIQDSAGINSSSPKDHISIQRNPTNNEVSPGLTAAYQAYIAGDLDTAKQYYLKELESDSRNKDVLLGLAAIAMRMQQNNEAQAYYLHILELDPRDSSAIAGMAGLKQIAGPNQTESRLKTILAQQPDAAALHFTLGNNYVTQIRWAEAQQSFFRALSIDPTNADYAFNLAVSLDHLKQNKLAAKYYSEALVLAGNTPVGFKKTQISERLKELTK